MAYTFDPANKVFPSRDIKIPVDNDFPRIEFYTMIGYSSPNNYSINRGATIIYLMFSHNRALHVLSYNSNYITQYRNMDKLIIDTIDLINEIGEIDPKENNLFHSFIFSKSTYHNFVIKFLIELFQELDLKEYYKLRYI